MGHSIQRVGLLVTSTHWVRVRAEPHCYLGWVKGLDQAQGQGGNDLGCAGARHLYFNYDDPRLLFLISGYPQFYHIFLYDLEISESR